MGNRSRDRLFLLLILLAGLALRLYRLGAESLWYDETVSTYLAGSPLKELLRHTAGDIHPPGYYILLRGWLLATGYPTGHADPRGIGLEYVAGYLSLFFGILLIVLTYSLARSIAGRGVALVGAGFVALSPYNIWYSQEVRMYTFAACIGIVTLYALLHALLVRRAMPATPATAPQRALIPNPACWAAYALASAAGLYTVYYFVFLLVALNLWVLVLLVFRKLQRGTAIPWLLANLGALALYSLWLPIAWRQAIDPPVPPWRSGTPLWFALREGWTALSLGQSAPVWAWSVLALTLILYAIGLAALLRKRSRPVAGSFLPVATFGPLVLILIGSALATPLYHVRYLFIYSPAFYIVLAAGLVWLWQWRKLVAGLAAAGWLVGAVATLVGFWSSPAYRADDLREATAFLESKWRPGDVVLVNAGYAYPALLTYWQGGVGGLSRLTNSLPQPRDDAALVGVMTGHVDGDPGLGWGDPRSDFFAMGSAEASEQITALFDRFPRIWHFRIYDTVNDPAGMLRAELEQLGQPIEDRGFSGEANMRVQGFVPQRLPTWASERPIANYEPGLSLQWMQLPAEITAGQVIYPALTWRADRKPTVDIATSVRLVSPDGAVWAQPPDERPLGESFTTGTWTAGQIGRQPLALPVPLGTPPGEYTVELVVYDPASGTTLAPMSDAAALSWPPALAIPRGPGDKAMEAAKTPNGLNLGRIIVQRPAPSPVSIRAKAQFGPLALVEATSPATVVGPGSEIPVELLWQATESPAEPFVVVLQLFSRKSGVVAGLEAEPLDGRYPVQLWKRGEIVRDKHTLVVPANVTPGTYDLIVGLYRSSDGERLKTRAGLLGSSDHFTIKGVEVR